MGLPQAYRDPHTLLAGPPDAERVGNLNAEMGGNLWVIYTDGIIDRSATARLRDFLTMNNVPHRSQLILNSDGGSLSDAMRLGKLIRKYGLMTEIGTKGNLNTGVNGKPWHETNPGGCYSACALAFLGGKYRFISPDSVYGVHRFHSPSRDLDADDAQIMSGTVVQYIRDMGVDPALFTLMTEAGPSEIIRVPHDVLAKLNAVNNGEGPTVWSIDSRISHCLAHLPETGSCCVQNSTLGLRKIPGIERRACPSRLCQKSQNQPQIPRPIANFWAPLARFDLPRTWLRGVHRAVSGLRRACGRVPGENSGRPCNARLPCTLGPILAPLPGFLLVFPGRVRAPWAPKPQGRAPGSYYRASGEDQPAQLIPAETSRGASVSRSAFGLGVYIASTRTPLRAVIAL